MSEMYPRKFFKSVQDGSANKRDNNWTMAVTHTYMITWFWSRAGTFLIYVTGVCDGHFMYMLQSKMRHLLTLSGLAHYAASGL
jgi:hypothetical protein